MNDFPVKAEAPGLCAMCRHGRVIRNRRGSHFFLCERSRFDPAFPRYPRLPVLRCRGYEASTASRADTPVDPASQNGEQK